MFLGPWEDGGPFNVQGITGIWRWLNRVWKLSLNPPSGMIDSPAKGEALRAITHKTIRKVTKDAERFHFNTMISSLMEFSNELQRTCKGGEVDKDSWEESIEAMLLLLSPLAPHITEELWHLTGRDYSIHNQSWPLWDDKIVQDELHLWEQYRRYLPLLKEASP